MMDRLNLGQGRSDLRQDLLEHHRRPVNIFYGGLASECQPNAACCLTIAVSHRLQDRAGNEFAAVTGRPSANGNASQIHLSYQGFAAQPLPIGMEQAKAGVMR